MPLLEVRGLVKRFLGVTAVDQVDLAIEPGELVSLIGPNGSGKTTLFELITGLNQPSDGEVRVRGQAIHRVRRSQRAQLAQGADVSAPRDGAGRLGEPPDPPCRVRRSNCA